MTSYHGRIMNLQIDPENVLDGWTEGELRAYKYGHRDARHNAAVLGNDADIELHAARSRAAEADARIAELEAELSGMVAAVELAAREEAAAKRDAAYWRKRGYDAERIASEADARVAELEAALPDPEMLETIATTRGQLSYDARDALCAAAERIRLALAAPDAGVRTGATGTEGAG